MRKVAFIVFFLIVASSYLFGQESQQFVNYEKKTLRLYNQKNWPELIQWGKKAIENGNDYFYMRMRLGIAFYERGNYHRALIHFNKAGEFNPNDPYLLEYLYYANIFINREKAALDIAKRFSPSVEAKFADVKISKFRIGNLAIQNTFSDFTAGLEDVTDIPPEQNGYQIFENNIFKANLGFNHLISRKFSLFYQYGFMMVNRFTYYQNDSVGFYDPNQKLYQNQFYILGNIYIGKGFNLNASIHYLPGKVPDFYVGSGAGQGQASNYTYVPAYKYNDFTGHLSLIKDFPYISLGLAGSYSYLNFRTFLQEGIIVRIYPLGNLNLYLSTAFHLQQEIINSDFTEKGKFIEFSLGFKVFNPVWLEISGAIGDLHYITTQMGWTVYNGPNPIDQQLGASLLIPVGKKNALLSLSFNYYTTTSGFISTDTGQTSINSKNYNMYSLYGGISWKF